VVLRPWRVVSMGGLLVAALKSSEISATLLSLLSRPAQDNDQSQRQRTR